MLDSLRYEDMDDRRDRLDSVERVTFEWALAERDTERTINRDDESDDHKRHADNEEGCGYFWHKKKPVDATFTDWLVADEEEADAA